MENQNLPREDAMSAELRKSKKRNGILLGICTFMGVWLIALTVFVLRGNQNQDTSVTEQQTAVIPENEQSSILARMEDDRADLHEDKTPALTLSDNPADYTFELQGIVYKLPVPLTQLMSNGWRFSYEKDESSRLPGLQTTYCGLTDGKCEIDLRVYNKEISGRPLIECDVYSIDVKEDSNLSFKLAKGVTLTSNKTDVISALGEPTDTFEYDGSATLTYDYVEENYEEGLRIRLDEKSGNRISISNRCVEVETDIKQPGVLAKTDSVRRISDNPADYTFELDGIVYQMPVSYHKLSENGWKIVGSSYSTSTYTEDRIISGRQSESGVILGNGKGTIEVCVYNPGVETRYLRDCGVDEIWLKKSDGSSLSFAKGIGFDSSIEDIKAAYGNPTREDEDGLPSLDGNFYSIGHYLVYAFGEGTPQDKWRIEWRTDGDVEIYMFRKTYSLDDEEELHYEVPTYLNDYNAPTKLGDSTTEAIFELDGKLYQMPCPVKEFIGNGWIPSYYSDAVVPGTIRGEVSFGDYYSIYLQKNGLEQRVTVRNFSENAVLIENCAVVEIEFECEADYNSENFIPSGSFLKFSGGLTAESSLAEFEEKCTSLDGFVITIEDSKTTHKYEYNPPRSDISIIYRAHEAGYIHEEGNYVRKNFAKYSCTVWHY